MDKSKLLKEFGFKEEEKEVLSGQFVKTGYPQSTKSYRLTYEVYDLSLEEPYFWVLDTLKGMFPIVEKIEDTFAAAENSAFFGVTQQRLGAQQDKISQFLATSGKMIKEIFQMVRELRILDERLDYYNGAKEELKKEISKRDKRDDTTLKGIFIDLVQGGAKSAASVFGLARELEFITLPDLFFDAPPFVDGKEMESYVQGMSKDFNQNVLRVLVRHLNQFTEWKKRTHQEHIDRRRFMLNYFIQHYEIIKMYLNWVKPYLRNVSRLGMKEKNMLSPDLISSFEGSMLDIEILGRKNDGKGHNGCLLISFNYRTRPELKVVQEGYQRGPVHIGRMEMWIRIYGWSDKQVEDYKKMKEKELMMMMGDVSSSVQVAMDTLGDDFEKYIEEAKGEKEKKKDSEKEESSKPEKKSLLESFFGDFYTPKKAVANKDKKSTEEPQYDPKKLKKAAAGVKGQAFVIFKTFKKAHRMVMW